jgi:hypothetical protein
MSLPWVCESSSDASAIQQIRVTSSSSEFAQFFAVGSRFPQWAINRFSEDELHSAVAVVADEIFAGSIIVEGPYDTRLDYMTHWRFFAFDDDSIKRAMARQWQGLVATSGDQILPFELLGELYLFRVIAREAGVGLSVGEIRMPETVGFPEVVNKASCLVHGNYRAEIFFSRWHALDLFTSELADDSICRILSRVSESLLIHSIEGLPYEGFLREILDLAEKYFPELQIVFAASSLTHVAPGLLTRLGVTNVIALDPVETVGGETQRIFSFDTSIWGDRPVDATKFPPSVIDTAQTYFLTPLAFPDKVAPFINVLPGLGAPKLLIHGPSQSGKTTLAKWIIQEAMRLDPGVHVVTVSASSLFSKFLGGSEKRIQKLFRKALSVAPAILFIENVHLLCPARTDDDDGETGTTDTFTRMLATFLMCLDGIDTRGNKISVITTSLVPPGDLDPAAVRPGRLEVWIPME